MAKRWVATDFGGLDTLAFVDFPLPEPSAGEVTITVRAAGMNPADYKHIARPGDRADLPIPIGYEVSGVITAIGPNTQIASGDASIGDEVLAFRVHGGYATAITVPAHDTYAKPASISHPQAANLLLAGSTAAEMLHVTHVRAGDTIVVHGASGAVGVSVVQQARLLGAHVIGTASPGSFAVVRDFGAQPVEYGDDLEQHLRALAPAGYDAALDTVGTAEAVDASLALVADRARIVTIAAPARASSDGFTAIGGTMPASAAYRAENRARLIALAGAGDLVVPVAHTYPLADALEALHVLSGGHPGGKLALIP